MTDEIDDADTALDMPVEKQRRTRRTKAQMAEARGDEPGAPYEGVTGADNVDAPKKRGRKAKKPTVEIISAQIMMVNSIIASMFALPELMLSKAQCDMQASATSDLMEQFDMQPSGKVAAIIAFVGVTAINYVPVAMALQARAKAAKHRQLNLVDNVVAMNDVMQ